MDCIFLNLDFVYIIIVDNWFNSRDWGDLKGFLK